MTAKTTTLRRSAVTVDQGVARLEMRDPASRNAFTQELKSDFADVVTMMRGDASIRVLVLAGSGGAFCSGGDLKSLAGQRAPDGSMIRDIEGIRMRLRDSHAWFEGLFNLDQPVIAAIDGPAFGAGFSLALAADFIVATPRTSFCMAFNRIGALPDLAALYMLPRMIGLRRAKDIMMTARVVGVDEALALGIVHSIQPQDKLDAEVMMMAQNLAQGSAQALAMTKLYSNQSLESDYPTMARLEGAGQAICLNSDYFFDAVSRFIERKPAKFTWNR
jgi:enoyl-CoA hydratase/carnithine racemase